MSLLRRSLENAAKNMLRNKVITLLCLGIIAFTLLINGIFSYISYNLEVFTRNFPPSS